MHDRIDAMERTGIRESQFELGSPKLVQICKALRNEIRREILRLLEEKEMGVAEIGNNFRLTQPTMSRHLEVLRSSGLIIARRAGTEKFFRLNKEVLPQIPPPFLALVHKENTEPT